MSSKIDPSCQASAVAMNENVNIDLGGTRFRSLDSQFDGSTGGQGDTVSCTAGTNAEMLTVNVDTLSGNAIHGADSHSNSSIPLFSNQHVSSDPNALFGVEGSKNNVDSALMAALRDERQRRVVLRLEQMLIEFMNDSQRPFFDIGPGASNGSSSAPSPRSNQANGNGQPSPLLLNPPKVQNKFQKLILHRLADRFEIIRENISGPVDPWDWNNSGQQQKPGNQQQTSFIIRLIKTPQSRIPKELLIDLFDGSNLDSTAGESDAFGMREMKQGLNSAEGIAATSSVPGARADYLKDSRSPSVSSAEAPKQRNKMKIMKRREKSEAAVTSQRKTSSSRRSNLRGKNQSDKEKAYAEARARIFAESHEDVSESAKTQEADVSCDAQSSPVSSTDVAQTETCKTNDTEICTPITLATTQNLAEPDVCEMSNGNSAQDYRTPTPKKEALLRHSRESGSNEQGTQHRSGSRSRRSSGTGYNSNTSSSSTRNSKATWRNRKEEENDPDFKRGRGIAPANLVQSLPVNALSGSVQLNPNELMGQGPNLTYGMQRTSPQFTRGSAQAIGGVYASGRAPHAQNGYHQQQGYHYASSSPHYRHQHQQQQSYAPSHSFGTNSSPQDHPSHCNTTFVHPDYRFLPLVQHQHNVSYTTYGKNAAQETHYHRQRRSWSPVGLHEHQGDPGALQSYQEYGAKQRHSTDQVHHFKVERQEQSNTPGSVDFSDLG